MPDFAAEKAKLVDALTAMCIQERRLAEQQAIFNRLKDEAQQASNELTAAIAKQLPA